MLRTVIQSLIGLACVALFLPGVATAAPDVMPAAPQTKGVTTLTVWRPASGNWMLGQTMITSNSPTSKQWGQPGDVPVPGDYDGDDRTDLAVWRPETGDWWVVRSSTGLPFSKRWGESGDVPVPEDYTGDGKTDIAMWRPANGTWYIVDSATNAVRTQQWGASSDKPVARDYTGDGKADFAVWRPSTGTWHIVDSATGLPNAKRWGVAGDRPVPGDYTADGKADLAVWRPSNGTWYIVNSATGLPRTQQWGVSGDTPVPADYDGIGGIEPAVWRPANGTWYAVNGRTGLPMSRQWGVSTDVPVPGNYTGLGAQTSSYPRIPPDFRHPEIPYGRQFSPAGGDNDRPVLVVYTQFTDQPTPKDKTPAYYANAFFGTGFGSVADYFRANSFGKLRLTAAPESQGTADDGIVVANLGKYSDYIATTDGRRGRLLVNAADPYVNYAQFDRNRDGRITTDELLIVTVMVSPNLDCGGTRGIDPGNALDGVNLATTSYSGGTTLTNRITYAHEISHQAFDIQDYDYVEGRFDLHGSTCSLPDDTWWGYNAWRRMHLGWTAPTPVTRDQFYPIGRASTTGNAYILYDPAKGSRDYFIVENRQRTPGTYDEDADDSGLVVWRLDDSKYATGPIARIPPVAGRPDLAWDPADPATPQRTMTSPWADGTVSQVAIRAIGRSAGTMWAYFDVRGPGVLADAYGLRSISAQPSIAQDITFPVMNTGETADTFAFTLTGLPSGWKATTVVKTLGKAQQSTATVRLTPATGAAAGSYTVQTRGQSRTDPAVSSESSFTISVPSSSRQLSGDPPGTTPAAPPQTRPMSRRLVTRSAVPATILASTAGDPTGGALAPPSAAAPGALVVTVSDHLQARFHERQAQRPAGDCGGKRRICQAVARGRGSLNGFGAATEISGLTEDRGVTPCGIGSASEVYTRRVNTSDGVLALRAWGVKCRTAGGFRVKARYEIDGAASTGVFAGASGRGRDSVRLGAGGSREVTIAGTLHRRQS